MPLAVVLLNYISCGYGILWRIFCLTGTFREDFAIYIINNAVRISEAAMGTNSSNIRREQEDEEKHLREEKKR